MEHPGLRSLELSLCLCLLYSGYETARASSLTLFNSNYSTYSAGVGGALTTTLSFVLSLASLQLYGRGEETLGGRWTLVLSAGGCCGAFLGFAMVSFDAQVSLMKVAGLFAVRETYVAWIGTQIWSMLSSDLKRAGPEESRRWFCIIQGVSCICSAVSGTAAGRLATAGGQGVLLLATALSLGIITATVAVLPSSALGAGTSEGGESSDSGEKRREAHVLNKNGSLLSVLRASVSIFRGSPLLTALLAEAVVCQVLTATLNMSFNKAIRQSMASGLADEKHAGARAAGFVGKSFALIGLISGALQLLVMPWVMVRVDPSLLLRALPVVAGCGFLVTFVSPGFRTATAAFALTKTLEYSVRGTALELIFQLMPDRERLLGTEAISLIGVRIGRTTAHIALHLCSALLGGAPPQRALMAGAIASAAVWGVTLRQVEMLVKNGNSYRKRSPPPPPNIREVIALPTLDDVIKARVAAAAVGGDGDGDGGSHSRGATARARAEGRNGAARGLRRRETTEGSESESLLAGVALAAVHANGKSLARVNL